MQANSFFSTSFKKTLTSILGNHLEITEIKHITGGDINDAFALTINDGSQLFMKCNKKDNISFFRAEATYPIYWYRRFLRWTLFYAYGIYETKTAYF